MSEAEMLKQGKIGVMPTDTIYGIVASALNEQAVRRVYDLKKRLSTKPSIILISSFDDLRMFGIILTEEQQKIIARFWPGPVSIILPCGIAFRLPNDALLISFLKKSGPCIAPSANPEELPPAETIEEAKKYFGDNVDFYKDGGKLSGPASTLIALDESNAVTVLRK
jgi:L-threonylcarbamoyladenylate synthase